MNTLDDVLTHFAVPGAKYPMLGAKARLAETLGCSNQNISQYQLDKPIPELWQWRLHDLYPERFDKPDWQDC